MITMSMTAHAQETRGLRLDYIKDKIGFGDVVLAEMERDGGDAETNRYRGCVGDRRERRRACFDYGIHRHNITSHKNFLPWHKQKQLAQVVIQDRHKVAKIPRGTANLEKILKKGLTSPFSRGII